MPRNVLPTPNSYETMTRPIALEIARQLLKALELPEDTTIQFPGSGDQHFQRGSVVEEKFVDPSNFKFEDQLKIEIAERVNPDYVLATTVHQKDASPYFLDRQIGVELKPVYSHTTLEFTIMLRARSRDRARRMRDEILARRAMSRETNVHEIHYSYTVPTEYLKLLKTIHDLREAKAGYGDTFDQWVVDHITERATNVTNQSGTQTSLVIQEHQGEILGWFDFDAVPDGPEKDQDGGTWTWNITYTVNYDKVIGTAAQWPLVVHNQIMPEPWHSSPLASGKLIDPARRPSRAGQNMVALRTATGNYLHRDFCVEREIDGWIYPIFDDFIPETTHPSTSTVCFVMLQVDVDDPTMVGPIGDFGDFYVDSDVLGYMRDDHQNLNWYMRSFVHVSLYENGIPLDDDLITIDENLIVRKVTPMNPRMTYRLRISLINNLQGINPQAKAKLLSSGVAGQKILMSLSWKTIHNAQIPPLIDGKYISRSFYDRLAIEINASKGIYYTGIEYRMLTVGNYILCMHRRDNDGTNAHSAESASGGAGASDGERYPVPGCDGGYPIPA